MCGIAAIFAYGDSANAVASEELVLMREQMCARGPDGAGQWISQDGRVGFAQRRLAIIDLSPAGLQPMFNADRSLAIVFNGEIYNYKQLRQKVMSKGRSLRSHSDTEVLLELYADRGAAMLDELRGMYAFAIWDASKGGVFLARDPFGIKPLYCSDDGQTLRVASQVKALLAGGQIDTAPEPAGHVGYFLWGHVPEPFTMYRHIRSVPAGSTMWIDRSGRQPARPFCQISQVVAALERDTVPNEQTPDDSLRRALQETVRYHLIADVPVGVFLSSGLDSTMIAALAAHEGGDLRTVTLGFEEYKGGHADETPLAEAFAKKCGAIHQTVWVSQDDFKAESDHLFHAMDQPSVDGVNTFFVSLAARRAGLKVALSGLGGDELFASYSDFRDIPRIVRLTGVSNLVPGIGRQFRVLSAPLMKRFTSPKYAGLFEFGGTYAGAYLLRRGMFMPWELPELLDPDLVRQGWHELQTLPRLGETVEGIVDARLKVSALELSWYMRNQLLRDSDWAGMGHSVEIRVPFVDLTFLRQIGPVIAGRHAPSKSEIAAIASELMSPELLNRPKTGFQIPVRQWLSETSPNRGTPAANDRGLRGWARQVYHRFMTSDPVDLERRLECA
jgi:asparagine synthase (glutamine-hydrolysing)